MDTQRDLLFGLLAYQKGVIDADCLAETCAGRIADRTVPLAETLVNQGVLTVEQRVQLEDAVREELAAHGGDPQATIQANLDGRSLEAIRGFSSAPAAAADGLTAAYEPKGPMLIGALGPRAGWAGSGSPTTRPWAGKSR
jgi:hypothetical protein